MPVLLPRRGLRYLKSVYIYPPSKERHRTPDTRRDASIVPVSVAKAASKSVISLTCKLVSQSPRARRRSNPISEVGRCDQRAGTNEIRVQKQSGTLCDDNYPLCVRRVGSTTRRLSKQQ